MSKLQSYLQNNPAMLLLFISIAAVYFLSSYKRLSEYQYWMDHSENYVVDQVVAMSSMDAFYWLKMARDIDKGTLEKGKENSIRGYPDLIPFTLKGKPNLLAKLISIGKNFTGGNYYRAGLILIVILAGLFVFPLFFYFNRLGFGASAVLGGLIGTFCHAYFDRTMMGRLDTDLLNTFFPIALACFILPMSRDKTWRTNILLATGAGITMYLYSWWYQVPAFILVYLFVMTVYLVIRRVQLKLIGLLLLVYLLASGPVNVMQSIESLRVILWAYISPPPTGRIAWPNILHAVAEAQTRDLDMKFNMLHGFRPLVYSGFAGLIYLCLARFRQMIPLAPILALGVWSMFGPGRFVMYLSPFIGVGVGVLIELPVRFIGRKIKLFTKPLLVSLASVSVMFLLFFATAGETSYYLHTAPLIPTSTIKAILDIKGIVPKHSAMFTPFWESGYALMEIGEFATYHDGGLQGGMRTTLLSKAMTSTRQEEMISLISYLEDHGFNGLNSQIKKDKMSAEQMLELVFSYPGKIQSEKVYILYLDQNIWKLDGMSFFGNWDFEKKKSDPMYYFELNCFPPDGNTMTCADGTIDLARGFMNDGTNDIPLRAALFINNGYIMDSRYYRDGQGFYLQVLLENNKIHKILVADDRLFQTNFNQQFLLGNYDKRYFEEVYNNFPVARVLKVKRSDIDYMRP